jgi:hypothetical protein
LYKEEFIVSPIGEIQADYELELIFFGKGPQQLLKLNFNLSPTTKYRNSTPVFSLRLEVGFFILA